MSVNFKTHRGDYAVTCHTSQTGAGHAAIAWRKINTARACLKAYSVRGKCREGKRCEYENIYGNVCVDALRHVEVGIVYAVVVQT